jgi:two-component system sensor histidine kinase/response regulator
MKRLLISLLLYSQYEMAQTDHDSLHVRHTDSLLGKSYAIYYTNPDSSLYFATLALDYATKHKLEVQKAKAWLSQARTEVLKGDIEPALKRLKDAAFIFERHKVQEFAAKCYGLMSVAVSKVRDDAESIRFLLKAKEIYSRLNNETGLRSTLVNLSNSYADIGDYNKAMQALQESKQYTEPGDGQWFFYYINAGVIYMNTKRYALAKPAFDSCIAISRRNKMVDSEVTAITRMAELYQKTNKNPEAIATFKKAIRLSIDNNLPLEESDALKGLQLVYETTGDYRNAFACQTRLNSISDSLFNIEKIKNIQSVEARLKVSEKEKTIALQKLDMEKSAQEQEKSTKRIQLLIAGTFVLGLILFFTFYFYTKVRKQKREVELQKTRAEKLNMLIDLMDKETVSKEDLTSYSADVRNQIIQSGQILDNLLNWAKTELNLSHNHHATSQAFEVTSEVIKELHYMASRKDIRIFNEIPEALLLKVPPDILKIVIRNLLSNAIKFSNSGNSVVVGLIDVNILFVKDNGSGINEKTITELFNGTVKSKLGTFNETGFGLGLHITHELIHKFNGRIWAENNPPSGTVFKFVLPLYEQN